VAFRNRELEELSQQYLKRISRYEEEQKEIVAQVIDVASTINISIVLRAFSFSLNTVL